jgi:hypothetical protein
MRALALAVALIVLAAGAGYALQLGDQLRFLPDESDYIALARNIVAGKGFSIDGRAPTAFRPPGYAFFLVLPVWLGIDIIGARLFNFLALAASVVLAGLIAARISGPRAAALAMIGTAGFPLFFFGAGALYPQILGGAVLLALLGLLFLRRPGMPSAATAGGLAGFLVLTIPAFAVPIAVLAIALWLRLRNVVVLLTFVFCTGVVVGGWSLRNWLVFERVVFVSSNSGLNLLLGNSENTTPINGVTADISRYVEAAAGMDELAQDAYYRDQALRWISAHPQAALSLYVRKVGAFFHYRNELQTATESSSLRDVIVAVSYYPPLLIVLAGLFVHRRQITGVEWLCVALYVAGALSTAVFFSRIRFRLPYDHLLIVLAAAMLARWLDRWGVIDVVQSRLSRRPRRA